MVASSSAAFAHQPTCTSSFSSAGVRRRPSNNFLNQARQLRAPTRDEQLRRDPNVYQFWETNASLLEKAWEEWSATDAGASLPVLDTSMYHPDLRKAVEEAWTDPTKESAVRDLWTEVAPGVYQCQFFDPDKISQIRRYLDEAAEAGIPTRPPHGIVLNRRGFMIDPRSYGYLAIPEFQKFYRTLIDTFMRPLGRLFYPEYIQAEDDSESFAFSIQYQAGKDQSIRQHTDASSLTLNINLNHLDGDEFSGSSLYFVDPETGKKNLVNFAPGMAIMHRGATQHAALPITSGERSNLVLWLFGKHHRHSVLPYSYEMSPEERWAKSAVDSVSPLEKTWSPF